MNLMNKQFSHIALILKLKELQLYVQMYNIEMLKGDFTRYNTWLEDNITISHGLSILTKEVYENNKRTE